MVQQQTIYVQVPYTYLKVEYFTFWHILRCYVAKLFYIW